MSTRQTEMKITALYERLNCDDELAGTAIQSSIRRFSWKAISLARALPTVSTIRTMAGRVAAFTAQTAM